MKIKYEVEDNGYQLLTKCPNGMNPKVGSTACYMSCKYFVDGDTTEQIVTCNYKEEEVTIEELKKELAETLVKSKSIISRLEKLESLEKQNGDDWVPKMNSKYWYFDGRGMITPDLWYDAKTDNLRLAFHNVYPTKEMAQAALPDIIRCNAVIRACRLVEPEFVPGWEDEQQYQKKFCPDLICGKWTNNYTSTLKGTAHVSTEEACKRVCDLLELWQVK